MEIPLPQNATQETTGFEVSIVDTEGNRYFLGHEKEHVGYYFNKTKTAIRELVGFDVITKAYDASSTGAFKNHKHYGQVPKGISFDTSKVDVVVIREIKLPNTFDKVLREITLERLTSELSPFEFQVLKEHFEKAS